MASPTKSPTIGSPVVPHPVVSGVYMLFKDRRLIYVGKSVDVYGRINTHRVNGREFDYATVSACPEADMGWVESAMIAAMEPVQNRAGKAASRVTAPHPLDIVPAATGRPVPTDPLAALSYAAANDHARTYRLQGAMKEALASGELKSVRNGKSWIILWGDLSAWLQAKQRERFETP